MRTLVTLLPVPFILMQWSATHAHPGDFAPSPAYTILDVFARCCPRLSILSPLHSLVTLLRPFTRFCTSVTHFWVPMRYINSLI